MGGVPGPTSARSVCPRAYSSRPRGLRPRSAGSWRSIPSWGTTLIRSIGFLAHATDVVLSHHEHFDGSGYPRVGRGGRQRIPLNARIFAVMDTLDAMTPAVRPLPGGPAVHGRCRGAGKRLGIAVRSRDRCGVCRGATVDLARPGPCGIVRRAPAGYRRSCRGGEPVPTDPMTAPAAMMRTMAAAVRTLSLLPTGKRQGQRGKQRRDIGKGSDGARIPAFQRGVPEEEGRAHGPDAQRDQDGPVPRPG